MLYDYLKENYKEAEPIFFSDVKYENLSKPALSQKFKALCDERKIVRYDTGIYYIPRPSRLKGFGMIGLTADITAYYKYISRRGETFGYYSGNTFANHIGITTQVPRTIEITSNCVAARVKDIIISNRKFIVHHPPVKVTNENAAVLRMLDLMKNLENYMDEDYPEATDRFKEYIEIFKIRKADVDRYIRAFPISIFKNYYELGLDHVLA